MYQKEKAIMKKNYVEINTQKIIDALNEHNGLFMVSCNYGSPYPDCNATIFFTATDKKRWDMSVRSKVSGNKIVEQVKDYFKKS